MRLPEPRRSCLEWSLFCPRILGCRSEGPTGCFGDDAETQRDSPGAREGLRPRPGHAGCRGPRVSLLGAPQPVPSSVKTPAPACGQGSLFWRGPHSGGLLGDRQWAHRPRLTCWEERLPWLQGRLPPRGSPSTRALARVWPGDMAFPPGSSINLACEAGRPVHFLLALFFSMQTGNNKPSTVAHASDPSSSGS